ncbi:MAG: kynureninase [Cyclobacteriaceae bacterium]
MNYQPTVAFATKLDQQDPLKHYRADFHIPVKNGKELIYFCGNSLGLQSKNAFDLFEKEAGRWRELAVEGHFEGEHPWTTYHTLGKKELGALLGANPDEVVLMNNLTTNLHVLLATFYRPKGNRKKILIEKGAFPSDHYAVTSFVEIVGGNPNEDVVLLDVPEDGYLSNDTIVDRINELGNELAVILLPGVQYYTGQFFDLNRIAIAAHEVGAFAGFDLAHAVGNLPMSLHRDNVDFATWCSYKYLNSGPGNLSGIFIHEKYATDTSLPRLGGWWGQRPDTRFQMDNINRPSPSVDGWMMSNTNILTTSIHLASLHVFYEAGIENLRKKSIQLTGYLEYLLDENELIRKNIRMLTPANPEERGCQLSLFLPNHGKEIFDYLIKNGVVLDWREPNVIRVAPTPMYNTFKEVFSFSSILSNAFGASKK